MLSSAGRDVSVRVSHLKVQAETREHGVHVRIVDTCIRTQKIHSGGRADATAPSLSRNWCCFAASRGCRWRPWPDATASTTTSCINGSESMHSARRWSRLIWRCARFYSRALARQSDFGGRSHELTVKAKGMDFVRTKVGDRYVLEALAQKGWTIGGEGSGHIWSSTSIPPATG